MATIILKLTLMIAVAISQAIGGVSCCCLGSAFSESLSGFSGPAPFVMIEGSSAARPACPKCSARKLNGSTSKSDVVSHTICADERVENGQCCNCAKLEILSNFPGDPVVERDTQLGFGILCVAEPLPRVESLRLADFKVPVRFGGHSWQSFACVWRN